MKNVRIIPVKPKENKKLRVAAYCRVSTSGPEQLRSLEIQVSAYKKMIKSHPNWLFAGVYYDVESGLRQSGTLIKFSLRLTMKYKCPCCGYYTFDNKPDGKL